MSRSELCIKTLFLLVLIILFPHSLLADAAAGAPASERVLLIYTGTGGAPCSNYNTDLKNAYRAAMLAVVPPPVIDEVQIACGNKNGFYDELVAQTGQTSLDYWCEVYDLRFLDLANNLGWDGVTQEDTLTFSGANNDWLLFDNFLNNGGHLFLQGEHHDYYRRNTNLQMYINHVANSPLTITYPDINMSTLLVSSFQGPDNFATDFNNLAGIPPGGINAYYPGGVPHTMRGSGQALIQTSGNICGCTMDVFLGYMPTDLRTNGKLVVGFETNAFATVALLNATATAFIQNIYDFLSDCYKVTLTKTFTPTMACVGLPAQFTLCYNNIGKAITNAPIWDTIPSCLTFNSSVPAPSSGPVAVAGGNLYSWIIPNIPAASTGCVTVNFTVTSAPPCP